MCAGAYVALPCLALPLLVVPLGLPLASVAVRALAAVRSAVRCGAVLPAPALASLLAPRGPPARPAHPPPPRHQPLSLPHSHPLPSDLLSRQW